jgi:hypothetical protein
MKKISIHRTSKKTGTKGYLPVTNQILQSKVLTLEESGLLCYLLSLPIEFRIIKKNIRKLLNGRVSDGRFDTAWSKLVQLGYIIKVPYFEKNLRRDGWMVFETPESRDTRNRDTRETGALYNTDIYSTEIENKEKESTDIINNTGASNTGVNSEVDNEISKDENELTGSSILEDKNEVTDPSIPTSCFIEAFKESIQELIDSTLLGEDILHYSSTENHDKLLDLIGENRFKELSGQLGKYNYAKQKLQERIHDLHPTSDFIRYLR